MRPLDSSFLDDAIHCEIVFFHTMMTFTSAQRARILRRVATHRRHPAEGKDRISFACAVAANEYCERDEFLSLRLI